MFAAVAALISIFYSADASLNATRVALIGNNLRQVERAFLTWASAPPTEIIPSPASAETLATEILDYGLIASETQMHFKMKSGERLAYYNYQDVKIQITGKAIYALYPITQMVNAGVSEDEIANSWIIVVCSVDGKSCQQRRIDADPGHDLHLVIDGERALVADLDMSAGHSQRSATASAIVLGNALDLIPDDSAASPRKLVGDSDNYILSTAPLLVRAEESAQASAEAFFSDETVTGGSCGLDRATCVIQFATDARASTYRFEQWTYQKDENLVDAQPGWRQLNGGFYAPSLSRNVLGMSRDGRLIAISADNKVNLWLAANVAGGFDAAWKSFDLGQKVLGLTFNAAGTVLHVATHDGLITINLYPRLAWLEASASLEPPAIVEEDFETLALLGGQVEARPSGCLVQFSVAGAHGKAAHYELPGCDKGDEAHVAMIADGKAASVVAAYVFDANSAYNAFAVGVRLEGGAVLVHTLPTPKNAKLTYSVHEHVGSSGTLFGQNELMRYVVSGGNIAATSIPYSEKVAALADPSHRRYARRVRADTAAIAGPDRHMVCLRDYLLGHPSPRHLPVSGMFAMAIESQGIRRETRHLTEREELWVALHPR